MAHSKKKFLFFIISVFYVLFLEAKEERQIYIDNKARLEWQALKNPLQTWADAKKNCLSLGKDWKLPSKKEFEINIGFLNSVEEIKRKPDLSFWSETKYEGDKFEGGRVYAYYKGKMELRDIDSDGDPIGYPVICVRSDVTTSQIFPDLFKDPNVLSEKLGKITEKSKLTVLEEKWEVEPGEATIAGKPYLDSIPEAIRGQFIQGAKVKILEYTGEGYSQIELAGTRFSTKIARSNKRCKEKPELYWRECWVNITKEPHYLLWKKVKVNDLNKLGWIIAKKIEANSSIQFPVTPNAGADQ